MTRPHFLRAVALFLGAFALYALTAQRGLGWGDSGEFQYRILTMGADGIVRGCDSFATAHPLYVALCKFCCSTPFHVTLVSAFFGALAVALFCLLARNAALAVLFALAHGLWWLSTVSEVYTLSLCFFAAELLALRRFRETGGVGALFALAALNGLHLEVHNLALLSIPVYAWVTWKAHAVRKEDSFPCRRGGSPRQYGDSCSSFRRGGSPRPRGKACLRMLPLVAAVWIVAASFWLWSFFALGPREVLFGSYGAQVLTLKPLMPAAIPLNLALGALSLAVPALLAVVGWWTQIRGQKTNEAHGEATSSLHLFSTPVFYLFLIHFLFWATYFIVSQYTFILPSALLAYLLVASSLRGRIAAENDSPHGRISVKCAAALVVFQLLLPVAAWGVLSAIGFPPEYRAMHPGRNDPAYFALPWHFTDDSASHAAALQRTPWKGYL